MRIICLCVLAGCLVATPSRATVLVPADLGELSREARAIARGRVIALDPQWTDDHRTIETVVSLEVDAYLKGALGPVVQFRVPGGSLGRFRSILVGAPEFAVDEHVVVFLGAHGPSVPYVLGLSQGVFRMIAASGGSGWVVTPPAMNPVTVPTRVVRGDPARRPLPLADFEQRCGHVSAASGSGRRAASRRTGSCSTRSSAASCRGR